MDTVLVNVTLADGTSQEFLVSEAAYDVFLNAAEVGIEGAADGENDAHAEDASEFWSALREQFRDPSKLAYAKYEETGDERLRTVM